MGTDLAAQAWVAAMIGAMAAAMAMETETEGMGMATARPALATRSLLFRSPLSSLPRRP